MNKDEILKEFDTQQRLFLAGRYHSTAWYGWLSATLDRYAFSIVEQSVPTEGNGLCSDEAREATLSKARELTNQPLKQER